MKIAIGSGRTLKIKSIRALENTAAPPCCPPSAGGGGSPPHASGSAEKPPCCGPPATATGGEISEKIAGFIKWIDTPAGSVPQVGSELGFADHLVACAARWGIGRMSYAVPAGLYAIGTPAESDPVIVTANYKMTFDIVRCELAGRNVWLLVLQTYGVNVWCAAGKGTFGTAELIRRIEATSLSSLVSHRRIILPILGAPGVAAHEVSRATGFKISYATIRASDLPVYLDNGMISTPRMRELSFSLYERLVLVPVDLVGGIKMTAAIALCIFALARIVSGSQQVAVTALYAYIGAFMAGVAVTPILLPWLPGRSFSVKGGIVGTLWGFLYYICSGAAWNPASLASLLIASAAVSAFHALNFTGSSTYTSRTGVKKEMHYAIPVIATAMGVAMILGIAGRFL